MIRAVLLTLGCVYLLSLVALAPAATVARLFFPEDNTQPRLSGIEGTLWQGRVAEVQLDRLRLSQLEWRADPAALLRLGWGWHLTTPHMQALLDTDLGFSHLRRLQLDTRLAPWLDATVLAKALDGQLRLALRQPLQCAEARGEVRLNEVRLPDGGLLPAIEGQLSCESGRYQLQLTEPGGELGLKGELWFTPAQNSYRIKLRLRPDAAQWRERLRLLPGIQSRNGHFTFDYSGRL